MTARKARNEVSDSILLAIEPRFAEKILSGEKRYEFRTIVPKADVKTVYMYAATPVKRIVGMFEVAGMFRLWAPAELWHYTHNGAGISYEEFRAYFGERLANAYEIANPVRFAKPINPRVNPYNHYRQSLWPDWYAPQNFVYLSAEQVDCILQAEEKLTSAKLGVQK